MPRLGSRWLTFRIGLEYDNDGRSISRGDRTMNDDVREKLEALIVALVKEDKANVVRIDIDPDNTCDGTMSRVEAIVNEEKIGAMVLLSKAEEQAYALVDLKKWKVADLVRKFGKAY